MPRFFNTAGPCQPADHYLLPPERRLPLVRGLVDQNLYFLVHAARQSGKTTCFRNLALHARRWGGFVDGGVGSIGSACFAPFPFSIPSGCLTSPNRSLPP